MEFLADELKLKLVAVESSDVFIFA
jgi:hypothetical protein